jgi:hypothetical protein
VTTTPSSDTVADSAAAQVLALPKFAYFHVFEAR